MQSNRFLVLVKKLIGSLCMQVTFASSTASVSVPQNVRERLVESVTFHDPHDIIQAIQVHSYESECSHALLQNVLTVWRDMIPIIQKWCYKGTHSTRMYCTSTTLRLTRCVKTL